MSNIPSCWWCCRTSIKTVVAFGSEKREIQRYTSRFNLAYKFDRKKSFINGLGINFMMSVMFGNYGLAF